MKCFGCGEEKDLTEREVSPHAEEDGLVDDPISPLTVLECAGTQVCRVVVVCHECFHRLDPDLWISESCWAKLNPVVPFAQLPLARTGEGHFDPSMYAPLGVD